MMSGNNAGDRVSGHFGRSPWMMIAESQRTAQEFVKNEMMNGKSAVAMMTRQECTDAIFTEVGNGAYGHLAAAGIQGWIAPVGISGQDALEMFKRGALEPAQAATKQGGGLGCHCSG